MSSDPQRDVFLGTPHRFPMLLVDRLKIPVNADGAGVKLLSANEAHSEGIRKHPAALSGSLIVDALGQVAITHLRRILGKPATRWYLGSIDSMLFSGFPSIVDSLDMEATVVRKLGNTARVRVRASIRGSTVVAGFMVLSEGTETGMFQRDPKEEL